MPSPNALTLRNADRILGLVPPLHDRYDLVVRWPTSAGPIDKLARRRTFPLAKAPQRIDPTDGQVWVAVDGALVARFRSRGLSVTKKVRLLHGHVEPKGRELQIEPGSVQFLGRPKPMANIEGGSVNPFGHPAGFRYMRRRPQRFVRMTDTRSTTVTEERLPITRANEWVQQTRDQAALTCEGAKHATEAALITAYRDWRLEAGGRLLVRQRILLPDGNDLWTDAYDPSERLLIEAKGTTDRPAIRMAVGQLLDYRQHLRRRPRMAILLPRMPAEDLIALARSVDIAVIWRKPDQGFGATPAST